MSRKILLCAVAIGLSTLFVRLGFWQLDRHGERSAGLRGRAERAEAPQLEWTGPGDVPSDTAGLIGRRARLLGGWDRAGEVILRSRTLDGRAGAELLTPFLVGGEPGQVVMVLRGWLPAPDGLHLDLAAAPPDPASPAGQPADAAFAAEVEGVLISSRNGRGGQPLRVEVAGRPHLAIAGLDLDLIRAESGLDPTPHVLRADDPPPERCPATGPRGRNGRRPAPLLRDPMVLVRRHRAGRDRDPPSFLVQQSGVELEEDTNEDMRMTP